MFRLTISIFPRARLSLLDKLVKSLISEGNYALSSDLIIPKKVWSKFALCQVHKYINALLFLFNCLAMVAQQYNVCTIGFRKDAASLSLKAGCPRNNRTMLCAFQYVQQCEISVVWRWFFEQFYVLNKIFLAQDRGWKFLDRTTNTKRKI